MMRKLLPILLIITQIYCKEERSYLENFLPTFRIFKKQLTRALDTQINTNARLNELRATDRVQRSIPPNKPFPCNLNGTRSRKKPTNINKLRPGDVDVIGAIGDSLTAGFGMFTTRPLDLLLEARGSSFVMGGDKTWREILTLANILKVFNPKLIGYSLGNSITIDRASKFNVAEGGAISQNIPYMTKILVKRILHDPEVDVKNDWKLVTIMIGHNDFCSDICYLKNPEDSIKNHKQDLLESLRILRDNLPRTLINLIPPLNPKILYEMSSKSNFCYISHPFECPCFIGIAYKHFLSRYTRIVDMWQQLELEIANYTEFQRKDFAVVPQTFTIDILFPIKNGTFDLSYMSIDCFHPCQKGYAAMANKLWNNMLERPGRKSNNLRRIFKEFKCPTEQSPFIFTNFNS